MDDEYSATIFEVYRELSDCLDPENRSTGSVSISWLRALFFLSVCLSGTWRLATRGGTAKERGDIHYGRSRSNESDLGHVGGWIRSASAYSSSSAFREKAERMMTCLCGGSVYRSILREIKLGRVRFDTARVSRLRTKRRLTRS
jgi:hypothetical protein